MPKTSQNEPSNTDQLTFLSLEPLARISPSPASEREWMERVATCPSDLLNLLGRYGPAGCCSKTSLGFLAPLRTKRRVGVHRQTIYSREKNGSLKTTTKLTKEVISDTSYPRFSNSGILSPTQHWTLSTSDWRSGATVCSLSEVLETGAVHQRYYLTSKACLGILRRAEKRGKELPEQLARALRAVAGLEPTSTLGGACHGPFVDRRTRATGRTATLTVYPCLPANEGGTLTQIPPILSGMAVRRLTPAECEKLQGFEPGHTQVTYHGKPAADGPRYKALGNSMAVPVIAWIGKRIAQVDAIHSTLGSEV